jgi:hypothetical protein
MHYRFFNKKLVFAPASLQSNAELKDSLKPLFWPRLLAMKIDQCLHETIPVLRQFFIETNVLEELRNVSVPLLKGSGWLLHGGRLALSLAGFLEGMIPNPWMDANSQALGLKKRFVLQWQKRWVELVSDGLWVASALLPPSLFLTVGISLLEFFIVCLQGYLNLQRLIKEKQKLEKILQNENGLPIQEQVKRSLCIVKKRIQIEEEKGALQLATIVSTSALAVLKVALILFAVSHPAALLVIALTALLITVFSRALINKLKQQETIENKEQSQLNTNLK